MIVAGSESAQSIAKLATIMVLGDYGLTDAAFDLTRREKNVPNYGSLHHG
jgi:hypothetical protein